MRKTKGIIAAVIVTILLIGGALTFQQNHANQASENVTATSQSVTSSSQAASATSQSRVNHKHQSSSATKKAHKSATKPKNSTSSTNDRHHSSKTQVKTQSSAATATSTKKRRATKQSAVTASKTARKAKSTKAAVAEKKVYLVVSGYKKTFFKGNVVIHGSATAFSVLQASKLKVVYQNGASVYVSSINGLAQNDVKVGSGWKYKVNNKFIDKAANLKRVSAGDRVHWYFTTAGY
ncbi:DUF4430 domain-containing protein [Levilactobacillus brevis]|uniref:Transcobalamin-like C-terminal domain-containing protein n=1 Tax=Levilactobacillus brevis ATCC 14869 = DSM 20054 TaxID=649758 RepID=U2QXP4_LEVBR|nr:DUF4430 domain-containing protein [Levilactobacillus brevis]ERK46068.1 hypothetical protein HMPREF0495_00133 [Levilactobacillus brevis ATCC 14869 = DSM 20054]KIO99217.1 Phosphonate ABC transporter phosphate-binding periplasmic component [Levilactobacillus brevis]KRK21258.1 hypothetical protein FC61_GL001079 [Levilactobacillus brevis ATCC 14869 = DSM 20054]MCT3571767.1 DUF4430 domain-containing protein [Levilactobacillus brevis]SQG81788.1 metal ion ABC transporter substrate-binding lipoprote